MHAELSGAMAQAADALRRGEVVAYPTEAVYGLGCDPFNEAAFTKLIALKQRPLSHGALLIGASFEQVRPFMDLSAVPDEILERIRSQWPGAHTWVFPRMANTPAWLSGKHVGIALRVTAHATAAALCRAFGGALVSTSANQHDQPPARDADTVRAMFGRRLGAIIDAPVGGLSRPTPIHDALSGAIIRA